MRIGSLFSGVGMLDYGCHMAGLGQTIWQIEAVPYRRKVLARHWPNAVRYDNVRTFRGAVASPIDIIVGGFPCKDVSVANQKGRGLAGAKSGLWFEMLRIIEECRPIGVLVENVARLVRRGLDVVVRGLTGLGYSVEATRIRASDLGAPHRRERIFIVAWLDHTSSERWQPARQPPEAGERVADANRSREPQPKGPECVFGGRASNRCALADTNSKHIREQFGREQAGQKAPIDIRPMSRAAKPGMARGPHGCADWLDGHRWPAARGEFQFTWEPSRTIAPRSLPGRPKRAAALGDGVVPQCAFVAAHRLMWRLGMIR